MKRDGAKLPTRVFNGKTYFMVMQGDRPEIKKHEKTQKDKGNLARILPMHRRDSTEWGLYVHEEKKGKSGRPTATV